MTRGQSGLLFLSCQRLSLFTLCRSPGASCAVDFHTVEPGTLRQNGAVPMFVDDLQNFGMHDLHKNDAPFGTHSICNPPPANELSLVVQSGIRLRPSPPIR